MNLTDIIIPSLIIYGIHFAFAEGNILSFYRVFTANNLDEIVGKKWSKIIQKPLWDCPPCMGSLWTILLTHSFDPFLILAVCGLNVIVQKVIDREEGLTVHGMNNEVPTLWRKQ